MKKRILCSRSLFCMIMGITLCILPASRILAADAGDLVKQANEALRASQSSMFNGNTDQSREQLSKAAEALKTLEQQDPSNSQLKPLTQRYERQLKDLDRRSGSRGGAATQPAATGDVKSSPSPKDVKAVALPRDLCLQIQPLEQKIRSVEFHIGNLEYAKQGKASKTPEQVMAAMDSSLKEATDACGEFFAAAQRDGFGEHADVLKVKQQLDEITAKVAQSKTNGEAFVKAKAAAEGDIAQDLEILKKEVQRLDPILSKATGVANYYNDLKPADELAAAIEQFEKNDKEKIMQLVSAMSAKYGTTGDDVEAKTGSRELWYPLEKLINGLQNIPKTRTAMADDLAKRTQDMIARLPQNHDFSRLERHDTVREWAQMAKRFDPESNSVKELIASVDQKLAADMQQLEQKIDAVKWPEQAANAPDGAKKLGASAFEWLNNDPGWGKKEKNPEQPIGVVVTGPWSVQKTNLLGEPVMYGLPVLVAVQRQEDKAKGIARVFSLTMRTQEKAGVKQEPPFDSATVGNSQFIRANAVK